MKTYLQNKHELIAQLKNVEISTFNTPYRLMPTSFDARDPDLTGFPCPLDWHWLSLEQAFSLHAVERVLVRTPLFWQIMSPVNSVCRSVGATFFPNEPENIAVGVEALRETRVNAVISAAEDVATFCSALVERQQSFPSVWFLVHQADAPSWDTPILLGERLTIYEEVHLFPGVPILDQCDVLSKKRGAFHLSDAYVWDITNERVCISSTTTDMVPLSDFTVPFLLQKQGAPCSCGKIIVEKKI